jgi:hypothetical protein
MIAFVMKKVTEAAIHISFDFIPKIKTIPDTKFKIIPNVKVKFSKNE